VPAGAHPNPSTGPCPAVFVANIGHIGTDRDLSANAIVCNVEEFFKEFLDPDPEADDFQNLIRSACQAIRPGNNMSKNVL